jgi:hypothetical protein
MAPAPPLGESVMRCAFLFVLTLPLAAATHYLTVSGLGGEPDYESRFASLALETHKLAAASGDARSRVFSGPEATKAKIRAAFDEMAREAKPDDTVVVLLIGHGSYDNADYKFNIPGPDLSAIELASALDRLPAKKQLVVLATSASGAALSALAKEGRIIITATKSGTERNAVVFARYWVEALRDPSADTDKNENITALEAYRYADQKIAKYYETAKRIATEHAMFDDAGKGEGVRNPSMENAQGLVAARFTVLRIGAAQKAAANPAKQALLAKKEKIELDIDQLKFQKAALPAAEYRKKLQALLLELAKTQAEIDQ